MRHHSRRAFLTPLAAGCITGALVAAVPVTMTALLAARSNRPEIAWTVAGLSSLHPAHLLTLAFSDLLRAMNPADLEYWGPGTWKAALGGGEINLAKNMGLVYVGALPLVVVISFGIVRGLAWSRDIRFFSISAGVVLLYAIGWYTPAFHVIYDLVPGVNLFRRPADATFVLGALLAIVAGYLVHRWLKGTVPRPTRTQRAIELAISIALVSMALWLAHTIVTVRLVTMPVVTALVFTGATIIALFLARQLRARSPVAPMLSLAAFVAADFAWNNSPHVSTEWHRRSSIRCAWTPRMKPWHS
jgi:hypothetical protein